MSPPSGHYVDVRSFSVRHVGAESVTGPLVRVEFLTVPAVADITLSQADARALASLLQTSVGFSEEGTFQVSQDFWVKFIPTDDGMEMTISPTTEVVVYRLPLRIIRRLAVELTRVSGSMDHAASDKDFDPVSRKG